MEITLKDDAPEQLDCKVYPLSRKELEVLRESLNEDLAKGYIKHRTSSYVSPIFFIPKKDGGELRMVIDYRKLNDMTKKDFYPLPNLQTCHRHVVWGPIDFILWVNGIPLAERGDRAPLLERLVDCMSGTVSLNEVGSGKIGE